MRALGATAAAGFIAMGGLSAPPASTDGQALRRTPVVLVFERCSGAVVNISSTEIVQVSDPFDQLFQGLFDAPLGRPREIRRTAVGSGFVIHPEGYLVTNAHVVARSTDRTVIFADGGEFDAQVVASDRESDIAVLKIEAPPGLTPLRFGRSAGVMIGETVIAIGNPLGYQHTVTAGVVSAVNRDLQLSQDAALRGLIQTDASINPGNSGGPLLNVLGELIGVTTAVRGDAQNIGFAIPVDELRRLLPELLDMERRQRIRTGIALSAAAEPEVTGVEPGSPAETAGVQMGDVLAEVGGAPIHESVDFHISLIGRRPGDRLRLKLLRAGRPFETTLLLEGQPMPDAARLARERLGLEVRQLPAELARELGLPSGGGFVIAELERGGPAGRAGMRARDVLVALGRYFPTTMEELGQLLEQLEPGDEIPVTYLRVKPPAIVRYRDVLRVR